MVREQHVATILRTWICFWSSNDNSLRERVTRRLRAKLCAIATTPNFVDNLHAEDAVWSAGSCLTFLGARPLRPLSFHHVRLHISACNLGKGVVVLALYRQSGMHARNPGPAKLQSISKKTSQIQTVATRTLSNYTCINKCIWPLYIHNIDLCLSIYLSS